LLTFCLLQIFNVTCLCIEDATLMVTTCVSGEISQMGQRFGSSGLVV